jgi:hypothetical protein
VKNHIRYNKYNDYFSTEADMDELIEYEKSIIADYYGELAKIDEDFEEGWETYRTTEMVDKYAGLFNLDPGQFFVNYENLRQVSPIPPLIHDPCDSSPRCRYALLITMTRLATGPVGLCLDRTGFAPIGRPRHVSERSPPFFPATRRCLVTPPNAYV